jgi:hypothetical protein
MPRAVFPLAIALALAAFVRAADPPAPTPDVHLATARDALVVAQDQLRLAATGKSEVYGDHRRLALELVNTALAEVDTGLRLALEEAGRQAAERQAAERQAKEVQQKRPRRRR